VTVRNRPISTIARATTHTGRACAGLKAEVRPKLRARSHHVSQSGQSTRSVTGVKAGARRSVDCHARWRPARTTGRHFPGCSRRQRAKGPRRDPDVLRRRRVIARTPGTAARCTGVDSGAMRSAARIARDCHSRYGLRHSSSSKRARVPRSAHTSTTCHRYLPALMQRAGWKTVSVPVHHRARAPPAFQVQQPQPRPGRHPRSARASAWLIVSRQAHRVPRKSDCADGRRSRPASAGFMNSPARGCNPGPDLHMSRGKLIG
jgi:hypothetical protein